MVNTEEVTREHVLTVIEEYDEAGDEVFLRRYGFTKTQEHMTWYAGHSYESEALLGVAMKHATGKAARSPEFTDGKDGAAKVLKSLDFEIVTLDTELGGADEDAEPIRFAPDLEGDEAQIAWAEASRELLIQAAKRYGSLVTTKEIAILAQARTGIHTKQQVHHWMGQVLARVSRDCAERNEPSLSSLCVDSRGFATKSYGATAESLTGDSIGDVDDHAAAERFECHKHWGAQLPEDGGRPEVTPEVADARNRARAKKVPIRESAICPTCNMALLPTGACDNCD